MSGLVVTQRNDYIGDQPLLRAQEVQSLDLVVDGPREDHENSSMRHECNIRRLDLVGHGWEHEEKVLRHQPIFTVSHVMG